MEFRREMLESSSGDEKKDAELEVDVEKYSRRKTEEAEGIIEINQMVAKEERERNKIL